MRTPRLLLALTLLLGASTPVLADHHGRGHESTKGFPGIYTSPRMTLTFTGDGHMIAVLNHSRVAAMVGSYRVEDNTVTVKDLSPPAFASAQEQECNKANAARYALEDDGEALSWSLIEDPCAGRARLFNGMRMNHYVRPQAEPETPAATSTE